MPYPIGGLLSRSSPPRIPFIAVAALIVSVTGFALNAALPEHQRVNRAAKADALVSSSKLKTLALKVPEPELGGLDEPTTVEAPVSDSDVFDTNQSCLDPEEVLRRFQVNRSAVGGKVVMLADGLQQSFSDAWRLKALVAPVRVSSVVAHLFSDPTGTEWNADVIEFDVNRCAMSRTLVPGEIWNGLLETALDSRV